jgi:HEAT repeat protein
MRQQLFLVAIAVGWLAPASGQAVAEEPVYKGRPLREWVAQLKDESPVERRAAARALGALGAQAREGVQPLAALLDDKVESVREAAADALGRIGGSEVAAYLYALVDDKNKAALLALRQCLRDAPDRTLHYVRQGMQRREQALHSLADKLAKENIAYLTEREPAGASDAALVLLGLGSRVKDHADAIRAALEKNKVPEVRSYLRTLLLQLSPEDARAAVPGLVKALRRDLRRGTWEALGLGEAGVQLVLIGRPAVAPLRSVLRDGDAAERAGATLLLGLIGSDAEPAAEDLRAACKAKDGGLRLRAALALLSVCPEKAHAAVPILRPMLDADWSSFGGVFISPPPEEIEVLLGVLLGYGHVILASVSPEDARAADALVVKILKTRKWGSREHDDDRRVPTRLEAYGLCAAGPAAKGAVAALCGALDDEDPCTRVCAAYALARSSPPDRKKALAALVDAATEPNPRIPFSISVLYVPRGLMRDSILSRDDSISVALLSQVLQKRGLFRGFPGSYLADQLTGGVLSLRGLDTSGRGLASAALEALAREADPKAGAP